MSKANITVTNDRELVMTIGFQFDLAFQFHSEQSESDNVDILILDVQ
ncbi:hypothetical protein CI610_03688 [invertebrate metagenome]|uniref:Uncharacterized protein n=1 Tax=invertebrate metagenome TaxID=1711999 RepID=A0A2H9T2E2_9ZZZZ